MLRISGKGLFISSILLLSLLTVFLYSNYNSLQKTYSDSQQTLKLQKRKNALVDKMRITARARSTLLFYLIYEKDPFLFDDYRQEFRESAREFIKARFEYETLTLSETEKSMIKDHNRLTNEVANSQEKAAALLYDKQYQQAISLISTEIIDKQNEVLYGLDDISNALGKDLADEARLIEEEYLQATSKFRVSAIVLTIACIAFIGFLAVYISNKERSHLLRSIEQSKKAAEKLSYQASHDSLTGLINRKEFEEQLLLILKLPDFSNHSVLYLDLDQFKVINDTCGHHAGDELLKQVSQLMSDQLRTSDIIARLGGDEFGVILHNCKIRQVKKIAQSLIDKIAEYQFSWEEKIFKIGVSIGVVELSKDHDQLSDVLINADSACYEAKESGRNCYKIYFDKGASFISRSEQMSWLSRINDALINNKFVLYAQIIQPSSKNSNLLPSYEILVRMRDGDELVPPGAFLPAAERYDQVEDIDKWVVVNTINLLSNQHEFLKTIDHISINLSCLSLSDGHFLKFLVDTISDAELEGKICLEITETAAINNLSNIQKAIKILRAMGVRFSLDDFGSGMSSFAYLKSLNVDYLKIDGVFVRDITSDAIDKAMVKSIRDIAAVMGKKTIAEFVENDEVLEILKALEVDYVQGYGIGRPQPLKELLN